METIFWNIHGFIIIGYLEKGKAITETYNHITIGQVEDRN